jgi:hypothetical protein
MTAALLALSVAVVTVIAYAVLADRIDHASVRRRQLDVWATLTACLCFSGIVYGGVETRLRPALPAAPTQPAPATMTAPADGRAAAFGEEPTAVAMAPVALLVAPRPALLDAPVVDGQPAFDPNGDAGREEDTEDDAQAAGTGNVSPPSFVGVSPLPSPTFGSSGIDATATARPTTILRAPTPTQTAVVAQVTRAIAPRVPATQTPKPAMPTATLAPEPLPSSTPNCGNASAADMRPDNLTASADRDGSDLVVHFDAQVRNDVGFPLTLSDISAVALNQTAGSEQYGQMRLSDIAVEPGAVIRLEGAVQLTKLPPPFGRTELCLSFVLDSCGQRADRTIRQCTTVRGF